MVDRDTLGLPFRATLVGDMLQRKTVDIFKELSKMFGITDDISVEGYDKMAQTKVQHYAECSNYAENMSLKRQMKCEMYEYPLLW